jgi:methylmalonyl-CoA mutase N-terminal domain/subunit
VESGETTIVGVNRFGDEGQAPEIPRPDYSKLEAGQVESLRARKASRDTQQVRSLLDQVGETAAGYRDDAGTATRSSLMPVIIDAVRARASVGEISDALREAWGIYSP